MKLKDRILRNQSKRQVFMNPSLRNPVRHEACNREGRGYRGAFKIRGFSCLVFGEYGDRDIESRQPRQPAKNKKAEQEVIDRRADSNGKSGRSRRNSKRDLSKKISRISKRFDLPLCAWNESPTRSAKESSSCPIKDDFLRHLATRPSMKSKKRPNGINTRAAHNGAVSSVFVK